MPKPEDRSSEVEALSKIRDEIQALDGSVFVVHASLEELICLLRERLPMRRAVRFLPGTPTEEPIGTEEQPMARYTCHTDRQLNLPVFPVDSDGDPTTLDGTLVATADTAQTVGTVGPVTDPDGRIRYNIKTPPPTDPIATPLTVVSYADSDAQPAASFEIQWVHPEAVGFNEGAPTEEPIGT